ncbi:hypothetical protein, partial [Escherichia coli]|uniref:hypothetical protein n=1 Tax=Escherichia coli TaxID=562 RepID=UPI001953C02B
SSLSSIALAMGSVRSFWMTTYCFSLAIAAAFFSENIPLERLNIEFGAFVFAYYFFMHFLLE